MVSSHHWHADFPLTRQESLPVWWRFSGTHGPVAFEVDGIDQHHAGHGIRLNPRLAGPHSLVGLFLSTQSLIFTRSPSALPSEIRRNHCTRAIEFLDRVQICWNELAGFSPYKRNSRHGFRMDSTCDDSTLSFSASPRTLPLAASASGGNGLFSCSPAFLQRLARRREFVAQFLRHQPGLQALVQLCHPGTGSSPCSTQQLRVVAHMPGSLRETKHLAHLLAVSPRAPSAVSANALDIE